MNEKTTQKTDKKLTNQPNFLNRKAAPLTFLLLLSIKHKIGIPLAKANDITEAPMKALNAEVDNNDNNERTIQTVMDKNKAFLGIVDSSTESTSTQ